MKYLHPAAPALLLALCTAAPAAAQMPATPRDLGVGGAYIGMARAHGTVFLNPANLGLPGNPWWSVAFPQFGLGAIVTGSASGDVYDLTRGTKLPEERRRELLAAVPAEGTSLDFETRAPLFAMQNRNFGLGVSYNSAGGHAVGRDLIDLFLNDYQLGRTDYTVGNTTGRRTTYLDVAAAYGRRFGPVSLGATAHYYHGFVRMQSRMFEPRFNPTATDIEIDYVGVLSRGGRGYGVDVGAAYQPLPTLTLSAALGNVVSSMRWSDDLRVRQATYTRADLTVGDPYTLTYRYELSEEPLNGAGSPQVQRTAEGLLDGASFPMTLRAGAALEIPTTRTQFGASFHSKLSEGGLAGRWDRMAGVGIQQYVPRLTLRAGYASNLEDGDMLTGGISIAALELGVARVHDRSPSGTAADGWFGTLGVNVQTKAPRP